MKSLCIIAIGTLFIFGSSSAVYAQDWKDKVGIKKTGKTYAKDLNEEQTMELLGGYRPDDGVISDFHGSHIGQVVFSSTELDPKEVTASNTKSKFGINEQIYFTFFLARSLRNNVLYPLDKDGFNEEYYYDHSFKTWYQGPQYHSTNAHEGIPMVDDYGPYTIYVEIDGVHIEDITFSVKVAFNSTKTAYTGYIAPDPTKKDPTTEWIAHMTNLSEGDHKVSVEVGAYKKSSDSNIHMAKQVLAAGEFTLTKGAGEKFAPKMGRVWADYKPGMKDAALEAQALKVMQDYAAAKNYTEKFVALIIQSGDWFIVRNQLTGAVISRNIKVLCRSTWPDGQCKVQSFLIQQDHDGNDYQKTIYCAGTKSIQQTIDCE